MRTAGLRGRLAVAFVSVALAAIAVQSALALVSASDRVSGLVDRENRDTSRSVATSLSQAYAAAGSWAHADTGPAAVLAATAGAELQVRDASGDAVPVDTRGPMAGMAVEMAQMHGGTVAGGLGDPIVVSIRAGGATVGRGVLRFPARLPSADRGLADALRRTVLIGAVLAALLAFVVAGVVSRRITRPLRSLTAAARAMASGDLDARADVQVSGELGELGGAFDHMADAVAREDRLRRGLAADVAHELRTPLAVLQAYTEQMADGLAEPTPERLRSLHDEVVRLTRSVEDLETLASAESATLRLTRAPVQLDAVAASVAAAMRPRFEAADITLHTEIAVVLVTGDADRLAQIARNLLTNALKFTPPGGQVTLSTRSSKAGSELSVADTGIGVAPDERDRVFDRFWRSGDAAAVSGSGVGLAVVLELVTAHGGTVDLSAPSGGGALFTVRLPRPASRRLAGNPQPRASLAVVKRLEP